MTTGSVPSTHTGIPVKAEAEWRALEHALVGSGAQPPCTGRGADFDAPAASEAAERAAAACWTCPVRSQCLAFAVANGEHHGVWGGHHLQPERPPKVPPTLTTTTTTAGAAQPGRPPATRGPVT